MPDLPSLIRHDGAASVEFVYGNERLLLVAGAPDAVRIIACQGDPRQVGPLLCTGRLDEPVVSTITVGEDCWWWSTGALRVRIDRRTLALAWHDADGRLLLAEPARGGRRLQPIEVVRTEVGPQTTFRSVASPDGSKVVAEGLVRRVDRMALRTSWLHQLDPDEALYGLGSHEDGRLDYRGRSQELYHHNTKVPIPVLLSSRGWGLVIDSGSYLHVEDGREGLRIDCACEDALDAWFLYGPRLDRLVARFRQLTGPVAPLPPWAFGYVQSKERYVDQAELLAIAAEFRRRRIPLDLLVQDWKTWSGDWWGQKSVDPERFPDLSALVSGLHAQDVRLMWSIWPCMRNDGPDQIELREARALCGDGSTYDATIPAARALYADQLHRGLARHGIDAWWTDCAEPFNADWHGACKLDRARRTAMNVAAAEQHLDPERINLYPVDHARTIADLHARTRPGEPLLNLTRAAYPGSQRHATVVWSGDVPARWDVLRGQIAEALNYCATGMPWWTCDVGGFFTGNRACARRWLGDAAADPPWFWDGDYEDGVADPAYRELYLRWLQFAAFLPMMRSHGTDTPREPWRFGEPGEAIYDAVVACIQLRYRLLPYFASLAQAVVAADAIWLRLLAFDFPDDAAGLRIDDQFMCGPSLLVCPVTRPRQDGGARRRLRLPAGRAWFDLWTGQRHEGGQDLEVAAPLDRCPVFVPAGSVLVLGGPRQHVHDPCGADLEVRVYPGRSVAFHLHEVWPDGSDLSIDADIAWDEARQQAEVRHGPGSSQRRPLRVMLAAGLPLA